MNRTIRRTMTVVGAAVSIFTLSTGTAFAHYCYRTDVPAGSNMQQGGAWATQEEMLANFAAAPIPMPADCKARILQHIASLPEGTLFMGPGLLAAGAVQKGQGPEGVGHLFEDARAFPECAVLFQL